MGHGGVMGGGVTGDCTPNVHQKRGGERRFLVLCRTGVRPFSESGVLGASENQWGGNIGSVVPTAQTRFNQNNDVEQDGVKELWTLDKHLRY